MGSVKLDKPRINHLAFTVSRDVLDAEGRQRIAAFFRECFGFEQRDPGAEYRDYILSLQMGDSNSIHDADQLYLVLIGHDKPYSTNPGHMGDHFGMTLGSKAEYDNVLEKAKEFAARRLGCGDEEGTSCGQPTVATAGVSDCDSV
jgi:hypothetical protein